jgi:hypothetical protein
MSQILKKPIINHYDSLIYLHKNVQGFILELLGFFNFVHSILKS